MTVVDVLGGLALGGALGYGGARLAPRWLKRPQWGQAAYAAAAANAVLVGLLAASHGLGPYFWTQLVFLSLLTLASLVDLHERIIPNEVVLFGLGAGILLLLIAPYPERSWLQALGGAGAGFGFLLVLALLVKGGMGLGDVKLAAVIGLFLGLRWVGMGLVFAFLLGGVLSGALLLLRIVGRKDHVPFGPFLALGAAVTAIYGPQIWQWYTSL